MIQFPDIFQFLEFFDFLRGYPAAYVVLVTSGLTLILGDWRLSLLALGIQYLVAGLLFVDVLDPRLSLALLLVGIFDCLILYITARQVNLGRLPVDVTAEEALQLRRERLVRLGPYMLPTDTPFRVLLALMLALVVWTFSQRATFHLPGAAEHANLAIYALMAMGLATLSLTSEPMKAGIGVLTFLTGFQLFFVGLEQSIALLALLAIANVIIVLVIAYLIQARHAFPELLD
jgi:hypothetical protein